MVAGRGPASRRRPTPTSRSRARRRARSRAAAAARASRAARRGPTGGPVGLELLDDDAVEEGTQLLAHVPATDTWPSCGAPLASPPMPPAPPPPAAREQSRSSPASGEVARVDRRRVLGQSRPRAAGRRSSSRPDGGEPVELSGGERAHDEQPDGVHRGARGAALAAGRQPRVHRHRLAADARLDDEVDRGLEAQGLEDGRRRPGQEPGPRARARGRDRPPRRTCAGTGCAGTRPAPRTRTRRSTTAPTASRSPRPPRCAPPPSSTSPSRPRSTASAGPRGA